MLMLAKMSDRNGGKRRRVTLHDVAREAGVSIKTVSRVINEESVVGEATRAGVQLAIDRLGYRPDELARGLRGSRSRTIGLIVADISNPFSADLCKEVEEVARRRGYSVILCASAEDSATENEYVEILVQRRIDGLLLVPAPGDHDHLARESEKGLPMVALDRPVDGAETDTVLAESRPSARLATEHLVVHGHRRVAFIGDDEGIYTARRRLAGYLDTMEGAGYSPLYRMGAGDIASAAACTRELLSVQNPPTALFAGNSLITAGILRALDESGIHPPHDMSLVGFEDTELLSSLRPRLTSVRQPSKEMGRRAAQLLFQRIDGEDLPLQHVSLPTEFIVNNSCGCA